MVLSNKVVSATGLLSRTEGLAQRKLIHLHFKICKLGEQTVTKSLREKVGVTVRHYQPDDDLYQVEQICKNVYGGTDALPGLINMFAAQPHTSIFVAENDNPQILALLCLQLRGDTVWVWGVRTLEAARQQGLATLLMNHAEQHARCLPSARWMLSTTLTPNTTMRKLFAQLGYCQQARVDVWPSAPLTQQALRMLEGNGGSHWEARSRPALLDFAPECLEAELRAVSGSKELLEQWEVHVWQGRAGQGAWGIIMHSAVVLMAYVLRGKGGYAWWAAPFQHYQTEASMQRGAAPAPTLARTPCLSVDQLLSIHARLREKRTTGMRQDEERNGGVLDGGQLGASPGGEDERGFSSKRELSGREGAVAWLPLDYKVLPMEGDAARGMIKEGHLWVLPPSPPPSAQTPPSPDTHAEGPNCSTPGAAHAGVLLVSYSMDYQLWTAGIVADSEAVLAAAVLKALEVQPLCVRFYIDRCDRYEGPRCLQRLEHQDSDCLERGVQEVASYLVYHKEL